MMKILRTIIVTFVIVFIATFVFLLFLGKDMITGQLENALQRKVNIDYVGLTLPFNLEIKKIDIPGLAKVDYALISPSIPGIISGKIVLNDLKMVSPKIIYEKVQAKTAAAAAGTLPDISATPVASLPAPKPAPPKEFGSGQQWRSKYLRLIIKNLNIKDGRIDFIDHSIPGEGIKITLKNINFHLTNLYIYPKSAVTNFEINGMIPWLEGQSEGKVEAKGWVNLFKKDMQATVKVSDIDGVYLYPYYSQWVDLEKTRIQSAKLNFTSNIKSRDNNLAAECHLELNDIVFKQRQEEEMSKAEKIASAVLDIFKALNQGKVVFNFTIKTKMTSPGFDFGYIKTAFEDNLREGMKYTRVNYADILKVPVRRVGKTANDLGHAVFNGTFGLVKVFKDTLKVAFEKEIDQE